MSYYPQLRAFLIWIYFSHPNLLQIILPPVNHQTARIIALKRLLSICYQKTFPKSANPHKHWFLLNIFVYSISTIPKDFISRHINLVDLLTITKIHGLVGSCYGKIKDRFANSIPCSLFCQNLCMCNICIF